MLDLGARIILYLSVRQHHGAKSRSFPRISSTLVAAKGDISKRDGAVKHSQVHFLRQWYVIRKNGLHISLITHDLYLG